MEYKQFKRLRIITAMFVSATVATAVTYNNIVLALAGVVIGMLFLLLVKRRTKALLVDERMLSIGGQAARMTYTILTVTFAFLSLILIMVGRKIGESDYESLGTIFSYVALLNLALYALAYKYFSKKYGE